MDDRIRKLWREKSKLRDDLAKIHIELKEKDTTIVSLSEKIKILEEKTK